MKRRQLIHLTSLFLTLLAVLVLTACGNAKREAGAVSETVEASQVGSDSCTNTCHAASKDLTMQSDPTDTRTIPSAWNDSLHVTNPFEVVGCENCHGGGGLHWGQGPIPYPIPQAANCAPSGASGCHETFGGMGTSFAGTMHANADNLPDKFFFQGGTGIDQATTRGVPEYVGGTATPVTKNQHIEECSVCHNSNQRYRYDEAGNLTKPALNDMLQPAVACGNCHDAHQVAKTVTVPQRGTAQIAYPILRKMKVAANGSNDAVSGTWKRAIVYQANGAVNLTTGIASTAGVIGKNNELNSETLCASCHTVGNYKYGLAKTHQNDIYTEWKESGHGNRNAPAFAEFSANPTAYVNPNTGLNYTAADAGHQSLWPYDMALANTVSGSLGGSGSVLLMRATTTANAAVPGTSGPNDNYQCYKCHNGLTSIAYQEDVQGTPNAPVVFGDETVMCITCHDPHGNSATTTNNVRAPKVMSKYFAAASGATPTIQFSGNVFWDNTPLPTTAPTPGNAVICIFCHQGRESGYTLFKRRLYSQSTTTNQNFFNPHYLGTGAMLWGRNGYEYSQVTGTVAVGTGMLYGQNTAHQSTNCTGCHMAAGATEAVGGHTWRVISEDKTVVNNATCNAAACHNGTMPATNAANEMVSYRRAADTNDYDGNGNATEGISVEIQNMTNKLIGLLQVNGIEYDDTAYPYFFKAGLAHSNANAFKQWNLSAFKAAFNLSFVIKGLPSGASQINKPNLSAATHNYQYNIQLLNDAYTDLWNNLTLRGVTIPATVVLWGGGGPTVTLNNPNTMVRPVGTRPATNYDPQADGSYNPRQ